MSESHAAFLRGINVSGRRVKGADLCAPFETAGCTDVTTFRASGNVIFTARREPTARLTARIEKALKAALGYDVAVFLRTAEQVREIAEHEPFPRADVEASAGKLQVSLLAKLSPPKVRKTVLAMATDQDRLVFGVRELYWLPSGPMLEATIDLNAIEKLIGPTTRRTMGTIEQIAAKYFAP
jgi:uncharacterized protein (DUF1697 family)